MTDRFDVKAHLGYEPTDWTEFLANTPNDDEERWTHALTAYIGFLSNEVRVFTNLYDDDHHRLFVCCTLVSVGFVREVA